MLLCLITKYMKHKPQQLIKPLENNKKISKDTNDLNTINHLDLTDITTLHLTVAECTFFSNEHRMFTKIENMRPKNKSQ